MQFIFDSLLHPFSSIVLFGSLRVTYFAVVPDQLNILETILIGGVVTLQELGFHSAKVHRPDYLFWGINIKFLLNLRQSCEEVS